MKAVITCDYAMKTSVPIKLTRIGNSKGVRIPAGVIQKLGLDRPGLVAEIRSDGLLLKAMRPAKLSWTDTAKAMAADGEDWSDFDVASADGLDSI